MNMDGESEAKAPLLVAAAATDGQRLSSSGRRLRLSCRNSVNSFRQDFVSRLPDKLRPGLDLESASLIDFSKTTDLTRGKLKLNVDGSKRLAGGGGFGGVFKDEIGSWVCGYYGKIDSGTSLETELWALYKGLTVIFQKGMHGVVIETNAQQVVQLIEQDVADNFPFKGLLEDAKIIFRGCECTMQHVFKEGNLCADALAKLRAAQPEDILVVNDPPAEI